MRSRKAKALPDSHILELLRKHGYPWQVFDAVKEVDDGCGAVIGIEQANLLLAPFNLVLSTTSPPRYYLLGVLDATKVWPTNWCKVADDIVCGTQQTKAKFGRYNWPPPFSSKKLKGAAA
jgi:hypothetical protein